MADNSPKIPSDLPAYLTPRQVAELFQVRELTVRLWLRRRLLKGVKIGHLWRIPRRAVEEFSSE